MRLGDNVSIGPAVRPRLQRATCAIEKLAAQGRVRPFAEFACDENSSDISGFFGGDVSHISKYRGKGIQLGGSSIELIHNGGSVATLPRCDG